MLENTHFPEDLQEEIETGGSVMRSPQNKGKASPERRFVSDQACAYAAPRKTMRFGEEGVSDVGLALYLLDSRLSPHTVHDEGHFWTFTGQRWEKVPQPEMEHLVRGLHRMPYKSKGDNAELFLNDNRFPAIIRQLRSMLSLGKKDFFANAPTGINCANGFVAFDKKTGDQTIEPHSPDQRQRHIMPGAWDPKKGSEPVRNVLRVPFKGDEDVEDKVSLQGQAIAVGMLGMGGRRNSKIVLFKGESDCGKSAFIDMLKNVLPESSWDAVPPEEWGNPNMRFSLVGKAVNLVPELTNNKVIPENYLKMCVTGDACIVRALYNDVGAVTLRAQHIFSVNPNASPVVSGGLGREIQKRFIILPFNREIPKEEMDDDAIDNLGTNFPDEFVNFIVEEGSRYIAQNGFTVPASSLAAMEDWVQQDPALAWLKERLLVLAEEPEVYEIEERREPVLTKALWKDFELWHFAEKMKAPALGYDAFTRRIASAFKRRKGVEKANYGGRGYYGIKLHTPTESMRSEQGSTRLGAYLDRTRASIDM